jgi:hypothetical protein
MTKEEFDSIIVRLVVDHGIEITIKNSLFGLVFDLNTGMKSGLIVWYANGEAHYAGRYDTQGTFDDWYELLCAVKGCMYGGSYGDSNWLILLEQEGLLTKKVTTVVSYE